MAISKKRRQLLKGAVLGLPLLSVAGLFGVLSGIEPDEGNYNSDWEISPTKEQLILLKAAAEEYDFVCFAETRHEDPEISLFCTHPDVLDVLKSAGKQNYYLEGNVKKSYIYDKDTPVDRYKAECKNIIPSSWITSDEARSDICSQFRAAIDDDAARFVPVDYRSYSKNYWENKSWGGKVAEVLARAQIEIYGSVDPNSPIVSFIHKHLINETDQDLLGPSGDRESFKNIETDLQSSGETGGSMRFGAGHLCHRLDEEIDRDLMITILQEEGYSTCVINVHRDPYAMAANLEFMKKEGYGKSDVDMVVFPGSDDPSGIVINNKKLEDLYRQAIFENIRKANVSRRGILGLSRLLP